MTARLIAPMALLLASCASTVAPGPAALDPIAQGPVAPAEPPRAVPAVRVDVVRDRGAFTADFAFDRDAPAWVFTRSSLARVGEKPWRPQSWVVETPGVRLERHGNYDALVASDGAVVPREVRIRFTPYGNNLIADYDPAILFSDGSVALFNEHFDAFPASTVAEIAAYPIDSDEIPAADVETQVRFSDRAGPVLHGGRRQPSVTLDGEGTYVLYGRAEPIVSDAMATVLDPQLPAWLRASLAGSIPPILARYTERLGAAPGGKPTFLVSWAGPTQGVRSMGGSVLASLVTMRFEGSALIAENPQMRDHARWFVAHESAHFWLGQAVRYESGRDAWITEGGADLLAIRTVAALDPAYDARAALQKSADECIGLSKGRSIATARTRNEHKAYYSCGAMFGLVAEAIARRSGGDFFTFLRRLIDANRADGVLSKDEWLSEVTRLSGDPSVERDMRAMIEQGVADPAAALASLFDRAGVAHARGADGKPRLL